MSSFEDDHETMETYYSKQSEGREEDVEKLKRKIIKACTYLNKTLTDSQILSAGKFMSFPIIEVQNTSSQVT